MPTDEQSMCDSPRQLRHELQDEEYRYAYAEDFLNTWVATQIVTLREQRGLSQAGLGALIGTKQPGVSRLEDVDHSTWKTETLKKIARALGVRLKISFETFGSLLDEDECFSREFLERPKFGDDPVFVVRKDAGSCGVRPLNAALSVRQETPVSDVGSAGKVVSIRGSSNQSSNLLLSTGEANQRIG